MSILSLALLLVSSYGEAQTPIGEYCTQTYPRHVSHLFFSDYGTVSARLVSENAVLNLYDTVYHINEDTGQIYLNNSEVKYGAQKFPYISHEWNMRYDVVKDEVQFFSSSTPDYKTFVVASLGCNSVDEPDESPKRVTSLSDPVTHPTFCTSHTMGALGFHGRLVFDGDGYFYVELTGRWTSISLVDVKYTLRNPDDTGTQLLDMDIPGISVFPHLGPYFTLRYNRKAGTVVMSGPGAGVSVTMTSSAC